MPHPRRREHVCRINPRVDYPTAIIDIPSHGYMTAPAMWKEKKGLPLDGQSHLMGLKSLPPSRLSLPTFSYEYPIEITSSSSSIEIRQHSCFTPARFTPPFSFIHSFTPSQDTSSQDMTRHDMTSY